MESSDDPFDWDIDRVVREFTTTNRTWTITQSLYILGDLRDLEKNLVKHDVDGQALLLAVDDNYIKQNLDFDKEKGFKLAYEARWTIMHAISQFQRRSAKYKAHMRKHHPSSSQASEDEDDSVGVRPLPRTAAEETGTGNTSNAEAHEVADGKHQPEQHLNDVADGLQSVELTQQATADGVPNGPAGNMQHLVREMRTGNDDSDAPMDDDELSAPSMELSGQYTATKALVKASNTSQPVPEAPNMDQMSQSDIEANPHHFPQAHAVAADIKKKPRRLAPTLVTTELDQRRDRQLGTEADTVVFHRPDRLEPGQVTIGQDGRKRLVPNLISQTTSGAVVAGGVANLETAQDLAKAVKAKQALAKADLSKGYLGSEGMPVDDLFFSDALLSSSCEQPETDDNFVQREEGISTGRRLYVARRMRHFLMSQLRLVKKGNKSYIARRPYPENLVPSNKPSSFMLAQRTDGGDVAFTRENVAQWPELEPDHVKAPANDDEHQATFNLPEGEFPLGGPSSYDDWDPDALRKWHHHPDDEVLPKFGESDDENEYDIETLRELEEEWGEIDMPLFKSKRKPLTDEEVNEAMNEGMSILQAKWHDQHLPKLERKAYGVWMKSRGRKQAQISQLQQKLRLLIDDRIPNMREEILKQEWTTQKQVRQLCRIMEQSISDREEILWEISLLKQKTKPAKPVPLPKKEKRQPVSETLKYDHHGGDSESIGSTSDEEEDDEDLADFITDDEMDAAEYKAMAGGSFSQSEDDDDDIEADSDAAAASLDDDPMDIDVQRADHHMSGTEVADTEAADDEEEDEDLKVRTPSRRRHKTSALSSNAIESIDLTADTPPTSRDPSLGRGEVVDLLTPIKDEAAAKSSQSAAGLRQPAFNSGARPSTSATISVSSDDEMVEVPEDEQLLAPLDEPRRIAEYGIQHWQRRGDRDRMLATKLVKLQQKSQDAIREYFDALSDMGDKYIWRDMMEVAEARRDEQTSVRGLAHNQFRVVTQIVRLFEVFIDEADHSISRQFSPSTYDKISKKKKDLGKFLTVCRQVWGCLKTTGQTVQSEREESPTPRRPGAKARVRPVYQDPKALKLRSANEGKVVEQQRRREKLRQRLAAAPLGGENANLIINETKMPEDEFIFVHPDIGLSIKQHQIDGVRFMWNQIVAKMGEEELQGCLLAHTMGLGKTMQVITLLVAIAEAANSDDPAVSRQIPARLKTSKTLILCPPGLLDNWIDELCLWVPEDVLPKIGKEFRKVEAAMSPAERLAEVNAWHETGGVLVIGFQGFRGIIQKAEAKMDSSDSKSPVEDLDYAKASKQLLEGPNIVIADEAHLLKNATSKIHLATKRFRTKSRIALTGSPLSNNVEEYHSMIDWVAPNYLGPIVEFRAKYVEPIQAGLYFNSTKGERRKGLKMLQVLCKNIAPKVDRCGVDVLKDDLPKKTEFIIHVPLTSLQDRLYRLYVNANEEAPLALDQLTKEGSVKQTTLWSWLGMLALLCNHPICFQRRLQTPDKEAKKPAADPNAELETISNLELETIPKSLREVLAVKVGSIMEDYDEAGKALQDSYKMRVISQILDASRESGDRVLVFSQSRPTILFLQNLFKRQGRKFTVLTGDTVISGRQAAVKNFNTSDLEVFLISTTAGGVGLNLHGANRVIIVDFKWSPAHEEQAIGRAYRLGQMKHVFVYRLVVGGTFEEKLLNQTVFKTQLAAQVVDKRQILANALRERADYLLLPKAVPQMELSEFAGHDPLVMDSLLANQKSCKIRKIQMSEAFNLPDNEPLTAEERNEVEAVLAEEKLKRENPVAWQQQKNALAARQQQAAAEEFRRNRALYNSSPNGNSVINNHMPPPSTPLSTNGAQHRMSHIPPPLPRLPGQVPRPKDPIMGSGTHMSSDHNLDPATSTILDQPRPREIQELEDKLVASLEVKAQDQLRPNIRRRAAEFVAFIRQKRPNEKSLLEGRITKACDVFSKYLATTNDLLSGTRPLASIVNDALDEQLEGPESSNSIPYGPATKSDVGRADDSHESVESQRRTGSLNSREGSPKIPEALGLRQGVQATFVLTLQNSIELSIQDNPALAEDYRKVDSQLNGSTTELAQSFANEIDSAVLRHLQKRSHDDPDETWTSVVFARAADFIQQKMLIPAICAVWMKEDGMSVKKIVRREMKDFFATPGALNPASLTPKKVLTPKKSNKKEPPHSPTAVPRKEKREKGSEEDGGYRPKGGASRPAKKKRESTVGGRGKKGKLSSERVEDGDDEDVEMGDADGLLKPEN